eukprot:363651-Chlamydomonas_euryale.AAC.6
MLPCWMHRRQSGRVEEARPCSATDAPFMRLPGWPPSREPRPTTTSWMAALIRAPSHHNSLDGCPDKSPVPPQLPGWPPSREPRPTTTPWMAALTRASSHQNSLDGRPDKSPVLQNSLYGRPRKTPVPPQLPRMDAPPFLCVRPRNACHP